jgi:hypothetical protein
VVNSRSLHLPTRARKEGKRPSGDFWWMICLPHGGKH